MKLSNDELERLTLHSAFGLLLVAKWMAGRTDVEPEIRQRLRTHVEAMEGILVATGHDWIREEIESIEDGLETQA
jgi:hypothetical protein